MSAPLRIVRRTFAICEAGQHGACSAVDSLGLDSGDREAVVCACDCHLKPVCAREAAYRAGFSGNVALAFCDCPDCSEDKRRGAE